MPVRRASVWVWGAHRYAGQAGFLAFGHRRAASEESPPPKESTAIYISEATPRQRTTRQWAEPENRKPRGCGRQRSSRTDTQMRIHSHTARCGCSRDASAIRIRIRIHRGGIACEWPGLATHPCPEGCWISEPGLLLGKPRHWTPKSPVVRAPGSFFSRGLSDPPMYVCIYVLIERSGVAMWKRLSARFTYST